MMWILKKRLNIKLQELIKKSPLKLYQTCHQKILKSFLGLPGSVPLLTLVKIRNFNESKTWDITIYNEKLIAKDTTFYAPAY